MVSLSKSISRVEPSPTQAAAARARALAEQGKDIISFTVGEPDFDTPAHVKAAAIEALEKGLTKYTAANGILPLREAICAKLRRDQDLEYSPAEIIVTNGGKHALATACAVLLNPGDEAIVPAPYWTSYPDMARIASGEAVIVQTTAEQGYLMSPEALANACSSRTKLIFLNTPSNPTGACYSREQLRALAEVINRLPNRDEIVVLSDEVYEYITYDGFQHVSFLSVAPELRANSMLINAFSKTYSMTGWRVGYAAGPKHIIDAMTTHVSQFTSNVTSIAQYAAAKAYEDHGAFPRLMLKEFTKRRDLVLEAAEQMPGVSIVPPKGSFFAFFNVAELLGKSVDGRLISQARDFAEYLLEDYDVVVVQGEAFGDPQSVRISFALATDRLKVGLARMIEATKRLAG
ncbi:MAG: pyridoxal phosphate-dependent aminotransferase [Bdellovibrionales bacterium]|nr:pyridoxal phosphate-dependent aminotransferase [Bdellovibrionales bacterium]